MLTTITISDLELWTHIGITEEERSSEQRLLLTLTLNVESTAGTSDALSDTADYQELTQRIKALAASERNTVEKFAEDIAKEVLAFDRVNAIELTLKKYVIPGSESVSVTIKRP